MEEAFDVLAKYARKEELEELPDDVAAVIKQMQGIVHTGGRYEVVTEEGEDGTVEVVVYTSEGLAGSARRSTPGGNGRKNSRS